MNLTHPEAVHLTRADGKKEYRSVSWLIQSAASRVVSHQLMVDHIPDDFFDRGYSVKGKVLKMPPLTERVLSKLLINLKTLTLEEAQANCRPQVCVLSGHFPWWEAIYKACVYVFHLGVTAVGAPRLYKLICNMALQVHRRAEPVRNPPV